MLDRGETYIGPTMGREVELVACVIRGIRHQIQVSLANFGSLFVCACVGAYVLVSKIVCFIIISNELGFTSFTFCPLLVERQGAIILKVLKIMCTFWVEP